VAMVIVLFWKVILGSLVKDYRRCTGSCSLHHQGGWATHNTNI